MAKKTSKSKLLDQEYALSSSNKSVSDRIVKVTAKNEEQRIALKSIHENIVTFLMGVPGTGKTRLAVGYGLQELKRGNFDRIIFTRPCVEAGEKLGYLPGSFDAKTAPFMMPMYEVVRDYFEESDIKELLETKKIIVLPFAYMRGINFRRSYVCADESQNATPQQIHLLLTRICDDSKVVLTGDMYQSDLRYQMNGLADAVKRLKGIDGLSFVEMTYDSCMRSPIVRDIDACYRKDHAQDIVVQSKTRNVTPHVDDRGGVVFDS